MALFFNFTASRPRQFQYRPLYYDERRERLEKMKARAEAEIAAEKDRSNLSGLEKGFLSERRAKSKSGYVLEKSSMLRFSIILLAILGIFYFLSPEMFMAFWKIK